MDPALEEILNRPEPGSAPAETAAPEPPAPAAEAPAPAEADVLDDLAGIPEDTKFDAAYVKKLRQEAAAYRTRAKQYEVFESYDEQDREVFKQIAALYQQDPSKAAEYMEALAQGIKGAVAPPPPPDPGDDKPLTRAEVAQLLAERDQQAAVAAETARIEAEATSLGYQVGSKPYKYLIQTALDETGGDIKAAHDAILAERQAWIDQYVGQKAREQAGSPVAPPAGAGTMPSQEREMPKSWADTKRAVYEMLEQS